MVLHAGSLSSLRNLVLGRCMDVALSLTNLAPATVALASSVTGQALVDNLSHAYPFDVALSSAHLFCASADASLLRKSRRIAVLAAAMLQEARLRVPLADCVATTALAAVMARLQQAIAAAPATTPTLAVRPCKHSKHQAVLTELSFAVDSCELFRARTSWVGCTGHGCFELSAAAQRSGTCPRVPVLPLQESTSRQSITAVTPTMLRSVSVQDGSHEMSTPRGLRSSLSPEPSYATTSPRSTAQSSLCGTGRLSAWKSVAEMRRQSVHDCQLDGLTPRNGTLANGRHKEHGGAHGAGGLAAPAGAPARPSHRPRPCSAGPGSPLSPLREESSDPERLHHPDLVGSADRELQELALDASAAHARGTHSWSSGKRRWRRGTEQKSAATAQATPPISKCALLISQDMSHRSVAQAHSFLRP